MRPGELKVVKPKSRMCVGDAFYQIIPLGSINPDNGREIKTLVKNRRGKMIDKNYGTSRCNITIDLMPVNHVIMRNNEYIIVV